jgi:Family of unknown function (DUF5990)
MEREVPLRITLIEPPGGVTFRLQRGKSDLAPPARQSADAISFDFTVRAAEGGAEGAPRFLGLFTQGPPAARFIYVSSGTSAGQADSRWTRRAKVPLKGITWEMVERALSTPHAVLEARITGTARDGGPVCASVPLLDGGWRVVQR